MVVLLEGVDLSFLAARGLQQPQAALLKCDMTFDAASSSCDTKVGQQQQPSLLLAAVAHRNLTALAAQLDLHAYLRALAVEAAIADTDWAGNAYLARSGPGRPWLYFRHDSDLTYAVGVPSTSSLHLISSSPPA